MKFFYDEVTPLNPEAWAYIYSRLQKQKAKPRITGKLVRFPNTKPLPNKR